MGQNPPDLATDFEFQPGYTLDKGRRYKVRGYMVLAIMLQVFVNFLLIMASKRMFSEYIHPVRAVLGALVGGVYCTACVVPGWGFLCAKSWYILSVALVCISSYGIDWSGVKASGVYCLLRVAADGIFCAHNKVQSLLWAGVFCSVCLIGLYSKRGKSCFMPVELSWRSNRARLQGLVDTGHSLRDPVTGSSVLIVGADVAEQLTGLSRQQLEKPVESIGMLPGLRLIPYKTVGQSQGMLLAMPMENGIIGKRKMNLLVAFAPQILDETGKFQALIGGNI